MEALPLLVTQFNSALIWMCLAANEVGTFNNFINGTQFLKGSEFSPRNFMIDSILDNLIFLEPLNMFLYTWCFLYQLEQEETNNCLRRFYYWFSRVSIVVLPLCLYCIVPAYIVELSNYSYNHTEYHYFEAQKFKKIELKLLRTIDLLALVCNLVSCTILALVMRLLHKRTKSIKLGSDAVNQKNKINKLVTGSHICVTLAFAIT